LAEAEGKKNAKNGEEKSHAKLQRRKVMTVKVRQSPCASSHLRKSAFICGSFVFPWILFA
jgi:hypothetical protein